MGCSGSNLKTEEKAEEAAAEEGKAGPGPESQAPQAPQAQVTAEQDMGCGSSKAVVVEELLPDITEEIKASVKESWGLFLQANEDSQQDYGMFIFIKLFDVAPESYALFEFVEGLSEEDLMANVKLGWHVKKVTEAISALVINLDDLDSVVKMLVNLGSRHSDYGVKEEYFVPIKEAVVYALEKALEDKFTEEHRKSWTIVMEVVVHFMIQGLRSKSMEDTSTVI